MSAAKKKATKKTDSRPAVDAVLLEQLVAEAKAVRKHAYAPYSKYRVGAALVTRSGRLFTGCNVENASYGAAICAERNAIVQMVSAGESDPIALAVVTQDEEPAAPCGICRQVLSEFVRNMPIVLASDSGSARASKVRKIVDMSELLPLPFDLTVR